MKIIENFYKIKKYTGILLLTTLFICGATGCNTEGASANNQKGSFSMGMITAIDGKEITVSAMGGNMFALGMPGGMMPGSGRPDMAMPEGGSPSGEMPEGFTPGNMPEGMPEGGKMPEGFTPGNMPQGMPEDGKMPEGFTPGSMSGGESQVIIISKNTEIMINGQKGSVSDLNVGDFIWFTLDGDKALSVNAGMQQIMK